MVLKTEKFKEPKNDLVFDFYWLNRQLLLLNHQYKVYIEPVELVGLIRFLKSC